MTGLAESNSPLNGADSPVVWPPQGPGTLGPDADHLYREARSNLGRQLRLDQDRFLPEAQQRQLFGDAAKAYDPDERDLAAVAEIEAAGLGRWSESSRTLAVVPVHNRYVVAHGRGSGLVRLYGYQEEGWEETLLAVLVGADFVRNDPGRGGTTSVKIECRHETATDVEHDAAFAGLVQIAMPSVRPSYQGGFEVVGVPTAANLPLPDTVPEPESDELCSMEGCDPHPFMEYLQPAWPTASLPRFVRAEWLPLRPYLVQQSGS